MYEVSIRVEEPNPYARATRGADATIELWCNDHCDLLYVTGDDGDELLSDVIRGVGVADEVISGEERLLITDTCLREQDETTIEGYLETHDCLLVPPLRYQDGAMYCRVLALDPDSLTALYRDLVADFPVTIETKHEVRSPNHDAPLVAVGAGLPELTERQREVIEAAYEMGYYRIPRDTTTADVAAEFGIDRRTAEEHLRRAENKLLATVLEGETS